MDGRRRVLRTVNGKAPAFHQRSVVQKSPSLFRILKNKFPARGRLEVGFGRFTRRLPAGLGAIATISFFAASISFGLVRGGYVDGFSSLYGSPITAMTRVAGLGVERVTISGLYRLNEKDVLHAAGIGMTSALPFVDVETVRANLMRLPIVKEASVRKMYPDQMLIVIEERDPYALWQLNGEISAIAADGRVMEGLHENGLTSLPLVAGAGAAEHVQEFVALSQLVPELTPHIRAGIYVGQRRWTLTMTNGLEVMLPEVEPAKAVQHLASLVRDSRVLEKDIVTLDLREPHRVTVRLTENAAALREEMLKERAKAAAKDKGGLT